MKRNRKMPSQRVIAERLERATEEVLFFIYEDHVAHMAEQVRRMRADGIDGETIEAVKRLAIGPLRKFETECLDLVTDKIMRGYELKGITIVTGGEVKKSALN